MTDLAFHRAVCEQPDDDTPRLILADLLEESGQVDRAEFVRVGVELARLNPDHFTHISSLFRACDCELCELRRRERELLRTMQPGSSTGQEGIKNVRSEAFFVWAGAVARLPCPDRKGWSFSRGFISAVTGSWDDIDKHLDLMVWTPPRKCDKCGGDGAVAAGRQASAYQMSVTCYACRGSGELPGATMPCPEKWQKTSRDHDNSVHPDRCRCSGSGRIPVPFAETMQPIVEVTLTTTPDYGLANETLTDEALVEWLRSRWPSIRTWNLPTDNAAQRAVAAMGQAANTIGQVLTPAVQAAAGAMRSLGTALASALEPAVQAIARWPRDAAGNLLSIPSR